MKGKVQDGRASRNCMGKITLCSVYMSGKHGSYLTHNLSYASCSIYGFMSISEHRLTFAVQMIQSLIRVDEKMVIIDLSTFDVSTIYVRWEEECQSIIYCS